MAAEDSTPATPRLPLLSVPPMASPEPPGSLTPPIHAAAAVPFRWEEEPGKPRPSDALATFTGAVAAKCLGLPPRLLLSGQPKSTKIPSPTTVLDGPYPADGSRRPPPLLPPPGSCRFRKACRRGFLGDGIGAEKGRVRTIVLGRKERRVFGWWGWKGRPAMFRKKSGKGGGGCSGGGGVFSSFVGADGEECGSVGHTAVQIHPIRKKENGASSVLPGLWVTIYEGLKQVIPWSSRKSKKHGLAV